MQKSNTLATSNSPTLEELYTDPDVLKKLPFMDIQLKSIQTPLHVRRPWSTVMSPWRSRMPPMAHSKVRLNPMRPCKHCSQVADSDQVVGVRKVPGAATAAPGAQRISQRR